MQRLALLAVALVVGAALAAGCATPAPEPLGAPPSAVVAAPGTVRILLGGDVMLGRGVAPLLAVEGPAVFAGIRHLVAGADLALANLESPLTAQPRRSTAGHDLAADGAAAAHLAVAGFDVVGIANNHVCDAGHTGMLDTVAALATHGVAAVGVSPRPLVRRPSGIAVAILAFDITGGGSPCVPAWDDRVARDAVRSAAREADLVVVGLHGGVEGLPAPDPALDRIVTQLASWGADVVWGHGAHVAYPVTVLDPDGDGRPTVAAPGLGNLVFDQAAGSGSRGALLEIIAGRPGPVAYRVTAIDHAAGLVRVAGSELPAGDAVGLDGEWWSLVGTPEVAAPLPLGNLAAFRDGDLIDASCGDVTGDGRDDVVVAFRRPVAVTEVNRHFPERRWSDADGRSAHVGVYRPGTFDQQWVAGTLFQPVGEVAACDGSMAVGYTSLDSHRVEAAGAWFWSGFGFRLTPPLPGAGLLRCGDVDGDGDGDPIVLGRGNSG